MSTTTKYNKLFSIKCSHEYYRDGACTDFDLKPTQACQQLLRQYGLRARTVADGVEVYYKSDGTGQPRIPISDIPDAQRFSFAMQLKNPDFHRYTTLGEPLNNPDYQAKGYLFYFDSQGVPTSVDGDILVYDLLPAGTTYPDQVTSETLQIDGQALNVLDISLPYTLADAAGVLTNTTASFATLDNADDFIDLELMDTIPANESIGIMVSRIGNNNKRIQLYGSADSLTWEPIGGARTVPASWPQNPVNIPLTKALRYLRIARTGNNNGQIQIAYVDYSFSVADSQTLHHLPNTLRNIGGNLHVAEPASAPTATLTLNGPDQVAPILQQTLIAEAGEVRAQLSLGNFPPGKYALTLATGASTSTVPYYIDAKLAVGNYFGVIEVRKDSSTWDNVPLAAFPQEISYTIAFTPRKSVWRYFIVHRSETGSPADFVVRDDENANAGRYHKMAFADKTGDFFPPGASPEFQGYPVRIWASVRDSNPAQFKPVRFLEEANPDLNLYRNNGGLELVRNHLPNPRLDSIAEGPANAGFTFSDVFIYT